MNNSEAKSMQAKGFHEEASSMTALEGRGSKKQRKKKQWKDFSGAQKTRIIVQGAVQMALLAWTLWDLRHRPETRINGSKRLWTMAAFVQPVGPIAYIVFGRKR
ncbi:MAG: PLD nuclease N-terminal domain-containing protein [Chloroflexia bacterium]